MYRRHVVERGIEEGVVSVEDMVVVGVVVENASECESAKTRAEGKEDFVHRSKGFRV